MALALSGSSRPRAQPWWTEADRAELSVLVMEFVDLAFEHAKCRACAMERRRGGAFCVVLREAGFRLYEWRWARILVSKAHYLRAQHEQLRRRSNEHHRS